MAFIDGVKITKCHNEADTVMNSNNISSVFYQQILMSLLHMKWQIIKGLRIQIIVAYICF